MTTPSRVSRRRFLRTIGYGSAAIAVGSRSSAQLAKLPPKKNLIVFLPDQLRTDTVAGSAAAMVHAPNMHKLALQSTVFDRTYVTQPICAPSRSSLLSGTWPHQNGCVNNTSVLPRKFVCLPEMLRDSGYTSAYFGKWHLGDEFIPQHGFSEWASVIESFKLIERKPHIQRRLDQLLSIFTPGKPSPSMAWRDSSDYSQFLISKGFKPDAHHGEYFSEKFATNVPFEFSRPKFLEMKACDFLQRHKSAPFIMFVAFFEPHSPYNGPFNSEHPFDTITVDPTAEVVFPDEVPLRSRILQEFYRSKLQTAEHYRRIKQRYYGLIYEIDLCIGAILSQVEQLGIADRTLIVLTSDHGDMMSSHGLLGKEVMYEPSATVPYVIRVPEMRPTRYSQPLSHIDFAPTMLELLGQPVHGQCVGRSRANLLRGEQSSDLVFAEWSPEKNKANLDQMKLATPEQMETCLGESTRMVVTPDGWKLCLRDKDKNELYNLGEDPEECHNLFYTNAHNDVIAKLSAEICGWQQRTADTLKV
jgi:arylsulfatase A-like enzyme